MSKTIQASKTIFALLISLLLIVACSGDGRPLEEAVEASNVDLRTLTIEVPAPLVIDENSGTPTIYENTGQQFRLGFVANNSAGSKVFLPVTDRRWQSSNSAVASVDGSGNIRTLANGSTRIKLQIGGVESDSVLVSVQNASLDSITDIVGVEAIDPCIPAVYSATGTFSDGTKRGLSVVDWTVNDDALGSVRTLANGRVQLTGVTPGAIGLIAQSDQVTGNQSITVNDSLVSVSIIGDTSALEVDKTITLAAFGVFTSDAGESRKSITQSVLWTVPEDNGVVRQTRVGTSQTRLTGIAEGATSVTASCGSVSDQQTVLVVAAGSGSANQLSFEQSNPLELFVDSGAIQLRVSTGSSYDSNNDVTDKATWKIVVGSDDIISLNTSSAPGTITPRKVGQVTVRASYSGNFRDIVVDIK